MIPLAAVPWRAVGAVAGVAAVALAGWRVSAWHEAYQALPAAQEALQREIECGEGSECLKRTLAAQAQAEAASAAVLKGYEDEIDKLRSRPDPVRRVIRVCADPGDVQGAGPAGRTDAGTAPAGVVSGAVEFDTAPVRDLARRADELSAQCRALIRWNEALAAD